MSSKKGIAILGSTGSIGTQALEVIESYPDQFELQVITANRNADLLIEQAKKYKPNAVVIVDETHYKKVKDVLWELNIHVYAGSRFTCSSSRNDRSTYCINSFGWICWLKTNVWQP